MPQFLESADKNFLKGQDVTYCIFTDQTDECLGIAANYERNARIFEVEHKPWPHATLKRFHFFLHHKNNLPDADYLYYCDVDSRFVAPIDEEILGENVAVQHCGYVDGQDLPFENRKESMAYVPIENRKMYFGGGFWGFSKDEFWQVVAYCVASIDTDESKGIVPTWHDESVLNEYFSQYPPETILSPSYHYPENHPHIYGKWAKIGVSFEPKILLLNKDHAKMRE